MAGTTVWQRVLAALAGTGMAAWLIWGAVADQRIEALQLRADDELGMARLERAIEHLHAASRLAPGHAGLRSELGRVEVMRAQWRADADAATRATEHHEAAISLNPRNGTLFAAYGWSLVRLERYQEGVEAFEGALALDPHNVYYLSSLGRAYELAGDDAAAREWYELAQSVRRTAQVTTVLRELDERAVEER